MAAKKNPSINELPAHLKTGKFKPVYFLFGSDSYGLNKVVELIEKTFEPIINSEFDSKIFFGSDSTDAEIVDFLTTFPFASEIKLVIVKEFNKLKDHKLIDSYINNPMDTSVMVLVFESEVKKFDTKFYKSLIEKNWLYEANLLKEEELANWILKYFASRGKKISPQDAGYLIDVTGNNRELLQMQAEKILTYAGTESEVTYEVIKKHVYEAHKYTVFDLFNYLSQNDKKKSMKIGLHIAEEEEVIPLIGSLNRFFSGVAQVPELEKGGLDQVSKGRTVGGNYYSYPYYVAAARLYNASRLKRISEALLDADLAAKSSQNSVLIITTLLANIFSD